MLDVPFYATTRHMRAGLAGEPPPESPFLAAFSGTTELLWVRLRQAGYEIKIIGGTSDLPASQFIDRVGALYPGQESWRIENTQKGIRKLIKRFQSHADREHRGGSHRRIRSPVGG